MLRALLQAFVALALLLQALVPVQAYARAGQMERTASEEAMPCHGDGATLAGQHDEPMPCCPDGACDCALLCHSPPALTQWAPAVTASLEEVAPPALRATRASPAHSPTLLRPPITA